jgi:hypothetical protein
MTSPDGTSPDGTPPDALRDLVREVLRDVLPALANGAAPPAPPAAIPATSSAAPPATHAARAGGGGCDGTGWRPVRLATDEDLHAFVLRVVALADNPKRRRDLLAGRLRFTLAPAGPAAPPPVGTAPASAIPARHGPATSVPGGHVLAESIPGGRGPATPAADHRIEKGAVTERAVQAAASAGARLVLGPRAVLTPLARDRARALGVPIEKER